MRWPWMLRRTAERNQELQMKTWKHRLLLDSMERELESLEALLAAERELRQAAVELRDSQLRRRVEAYQADCRRAGRLRVATDLARILEGSHETEAEA